MKKNEVKNVNVEATEENEVFLMDDARKLCKTLMRTVRTSMAHGMSDEAKVDLDEKIKNFIDYVQKFESKEKLFSLCKVLNETERAQLLEMLTNKED